MSGHALRFRLLPLGALLCVGSCLSTEGYYRFQDAGPAGTAGTTGAGGDAGNAGNAGNAGSSGTAGTTGSGGGTAGSAATGRGGTTGAAGTTGSAGRGGTTGSAGRGGTTGTAGRGGTTGTAGTTGGGGGVLFSENFDPVTGAWDWAFNLTHSFVNDGTQMMVVNMSETAGDQAIGAVGSPTWTNYSVEAKVKVMSFSGTSSSDGVMICARLTGPASFYYLAIAPATGAAGEKALKIKLNNGSNTSLSSSLDSTGFALNTWVTLRLDVQGNVLTAYLNGTMKGTYTAVDADKILPMGGIGLMVQRATAEFDDIVVRALP